MLQELRSAGFDIEARNHAEAILSVEFHDEISVLLGAIRQFSISSDEIIGSGGGEAKSTQRLRRDLAKQGWLKHNFHIQMTVDGVPKDDGTSHEIDHVRRTTRGSLALEIEWNNKDPFFDRDLENFQRLHSQSVISAGIIVTRGQSLQGSLVSVVEEFLERNQVDDESALKSFGMKDRTERQREVVARAMAAGESFRAAFAKQFVADKFGQATTHWAKLLERTSRGVGNPCPLLLIGLPVAVISDYSAAKPEL